MSIEFVSATRDLPDTEGDLFDIIEDLAERAGEFVIVVFGLACDLCCCASV
jgi:hypothetical protein